MKRPIIICFTGIDGSGKTSHALALIREMKRDIPCRYTWCRWAFGLSSLFHFLVRKTLGYTKENYVSCKPLQLIFQFLIFLDFILTVFIKVRIPKILGRCVVIDRYVYDILADLSFWGFDTSAEKFFVRLFLAMNPKPHVTFLVCVPPQIASLRKNDLSLVNTIEYEKIYNYMAEILNFQRIVNLDFNEAHSKIMNQIAKIQRNTITNKRKATIHLGTRRTKSC